MLSHGEDADTAVGIEDICSVEIACGMITW